MVLESEVNAERYNLGEEGMTLGLVQINRTCVCATVFHKNTNDNFEKNLNSQCLYEYLYHQQGFPGVSDNKVSACSV